MAQSVAPGQLVRQESQGIELTLVEVLESLGREANRGGGRKVELARVEELEERVLESQRNQYASPELRRERAANLENLGPNLDLLEGAGSETTDNRVGDLEGGLEVREEREMNVYFERLTFPIPDCESKASARSARLPREDEAHLEREEVLGKTTGGNLVAEELDQVLGDENTVLSLGSVPASVVGTRGFDDGDNALGVDVDKGLTDASAGVRDEVGLTVGRKEALVDVVETFEGRNVGVDPATAESAPRWARKSKQLTR